MSNPVLMKDELGKLVQPVRLHYRISSPFAIKRALKLLKCIGHSPQDASFIWFSEEEPHQCDPNDPHHHHHHHPVAKVLGIFQLQSKRDLVLDLASHETALQAILFFDQKLGRKKADLTQMTMVNRLFSMPEAGEQAEVEPLDLLKEPAEAVEAEKLFQAIRRLGSEESPQEAFDQELGSYNSKALPLVERVPAHYYEDGIESIDFLLSSRQQIALEHWKGNTDYTLKDWLTQRLKSAL